MLIYNVHYIEQIRVWKKLSVRCYILNQSLVVLCFRNRANLWTGDYSHIHIFGIKFIGTWGVILDVINNLSFLYIIKYNYIIFADMDKLR